MVKFKKMIFFRSLIAHYDIKREKVPNDINNWFDKYPISINDLPIIENKSGLKFRIYLLQEKMKREYYLSKIYDRSNENEKTIKFLLYNEHFMLIKNMRKLMKAFTKKNCKSLLCEKCGIGLFTTSKALDKHEIECKKRNKTSRYRLPKNKYLEFNNYEKLISVPFRIYADFESYFIDVDDNSNKNSVNLKKHKMMAWVKIIIII
jgi:hypothetical protein